RAVDVDSLQTAAITGTPDAPGRDVHVALSASGNVRWTSSRELQPGEDLRIELDFPKGLVAPPGRLQKLGWLARDHAGLLSALIGLLILMGYCVLRWRHVRRLQTAGAVSERNEPPPGFSPGGLRYLRRMRYDERCFAADLLAGAVDGHMGIVRQQQDNRFAWRIERRRDVV